MSTIFLIAMPYEWKNIFRHYTLTTVSKKPFPIIRINQHLIIETGITKTNSAMATQFALDKYTPKKIINIGLCGTISKKSASCQYPQAREREY